MSYRGNFAHNGIEPLQGFEERQDRIHQIDRIISLVDR